MAWQFKNAANCNSLFLVAVAVEVAINHMLLRILIYCSEFSLAAIAAAVVIVHFLHIC